MVSHAYLVYSNPSQVNYWRSCKRISGDFVKHLMSVFSAMFRLCRPLLELKTYDRYFRQLQELSDTVAEATWEGSVIEAIEEHEAHATELGAKINTNKARQRYLEFLAKSQGEGTLDEEEESCILCKCDFERGYITQWCVLAPYNCYF